MFSLTPRQVYAVKGARAYPCYSARAVHSNVKIDRYHG